MAWRCAASGQVRGSRWWSRRRRVEAACHFENPDCAFDLRATVAGAGQVVWSGVNLCDVKSVTLNRDAAGRDWVDYD